jgi:protoheme ferro-lyase
MTIPGLSKPRNPVEWLQPYTDEAIKELAAKGLKNSSWFLLALYLTY